MTYDLRQVPLFVGLPDEDLNRLHASIGESRLAEGETLFDEGDLADAAYVIAEGELEILKESAGRHVRIAVSGVGDVVGEMGLLTAEPRNATARAMTPVHLISIPKACLDDVLATSAPANRALFDVFIARWREQESRVRQSERMAQIGVLTAGLAHEMNNPAAAVSAGSERLAQVLARRIELSAHVGGAAIPTPSDDGPPASALDRADREDAIEDVLSEAGIDEPWTMASVLTDAGFTPDDLAVDGPDAAAILEVAVVDAETVALIAEISEGSRRLADLVGALKSYSFLDQAPVQEVDVTKGIDDTLLILRSKMSGISIAREYEPDLPTIVAYGSQLNQVWTNLLDNAADAINEAMEDGGRVIIRARSDEGCIIVEVENNGPAIPDHVIDRIFEAFYTTKEPGKGTGLGLDTAYSIVVSQHRGSLTVRSEPDATIFTVVLPIDQDTATV